MDQACTDPILRWTLKSRKLWAVLTEHQLQQVSLHSSLMLTRSLQGDASLPILEKEKQRLGGVLRFPKKVTTAKSLVTQQFPQQLPSGTGLIPRFNTDSQPTSETSWPLRLYHSVNHMYVQRYTDILIMCDVIGESTLVIKTGMRELAFALASLPLKAGLWQIAVIRTIQPCEFIVIQ